MDKRVGLSLKISGSLADKREGEADDLSDLILENSHSWLVIIILRFFIIILCNIVKNIRWGAMIK